MKSYDFWFELGLRVFAVIGLAAVLSLGVLGVRKLVQYRLASGDGSVETAGVATPSIQSEAATSEEAPSASPPATTTKPKPPLEAPGVPDLSVKIVSTGIINEANGEFIPAASVSQGQQAVIVFDITNIGSAVSERWNFVADLPSLGGRFVSETQQPLRPGDRLRFTTGFRDLNRQGENTAVITIDPQNLLKDKNRNNDSVTATLIRNY